MRIGYVRTKDEAPLDTCRITFVGNELKLALNLAEEGDTFVIKRLSDIDEPLVYIEYLVDKNVIVEINGSTPV